MNSIIKMISMSNYIAALEFAPDGQMAYTHIASIKWTDNIAGRYFIKIYPENFERGLINEITGYLLAYACGLPQPSKAGLIQVPKQIIENIYNIKISFGKDYLWGWATQEFGKTPNTYLRIKDMLNFQRCLKEIKAWPLISDLVSFDDWVANQDRNTGNITIIGKNNFGIIDHGTVPVQINWTPKDLKVDKKFENKLLSLLWNENPPLPISHNMVDAAKKHSSALQRVSGELIKWWRLFLSEEDIRAINIFIETRAECSPKRVNDRIKVLVV